MRRFRVHEALLLAALVSVLTTGLWSQDGKQGKKKSSKNAAGESALEIPAGEEDLAERLRRLEARLAELEKRTVDEADIESLIEEGLEKGYSRGVLTIGGFEARLGGRLEVNYIDTQVDRTTLAGSTRDPDPYVEFDQLRIEPIIDLGKKMELGAQLDFQTDDSVLREAYFIYEFQADDYWDDLWWFRLRTQVGLDDRFIHIGPGARITESYPLIGSAFWRDEEIAIISEIRLGRKRGVPVKKKKKKKDAPFDSVPRSEKTNSTTHGALDFASNPGALKLLHSIGNGFTLDSRSISKDRGRMQDMLHDGRETNDGLSLRSLGFGAAYERDFNWLGEISVMGYFFEDELNDESVENLQDGFSRLVGGTPAQTVGYGDSELDYASRVGVAVEYHLESYHLLDGVMDAWPGDGLYLRGEYIDSRDGRLDRDGWYVQASYRFSFPRPLFDNRYVRYFEPVARYGELNVRQSNDPSLPQTWDREEIVVGLNVGISQAITLKAEYAFYDEDTGRDAAAGAGASPTGSVDNDTFIAQLLIQF